MDPNFIWCLHDSVLSTTGMRNLLSSHRFYLIFFVYAIDKLICYILTGTMLVCHSVFNFSHLVCMNRFPNMLHDWVM